MGRRRKNGSDEPQAEPADATREHNLGARKDAINSALKGLYELDAEIGDHLEALIAPLREDKAAIKKKLREDFNITATVLNARYASYKLERRARESSDDNTLDAIREMFEALPIGGQGELFGTRHEAEGATA